MHILFFEQASCRAAAASLCVMEKRLAADAAADGLSLPVGKVKVKLGN